MISKVLRVEIDFSTSRSTVIPPPPETNEERFVGLFTVFAVIMMMYLRYMYAMQALSCTYPFMYISSFLLRSNLQINRLLLVNLVVLLVWGVKP